MDSHILCKTINQLAAEFTMMNYNHSEIHGDNIRRSNYWSWEWSIASASPMRLCFWLSL